jgi:hypothetical protein
MTNYTGPFERRRDPFIVAAADNFCGVRANDGFCGFSSGIFSAGRQAELIPPRHPQRPEVSEKSMPEPQ